MTRWRLGRYMVVDDYPGTRLPWRVFYRGMAMTRRHGHFRGWRRFGSAEAAKRWVEKRCWAVERKQGWSMSADEGATSSWPVAWEAV